MKKILIISIIVLFSSISLAHGYDLQEGFDSYKTCSSGSSAVCDHAWNIQPDITGITWTDTTIGISGNNVKLDGTARAYTTGVRILQDVNYTEWYGFALVRYHATDQAGDIAVMASVDSGGTHTIALYLTTAGKLFVQTPGALSNESTDVMSPDTNYCIWWYYKPASGGGGNAISWAEFAVPVEGACTYVGSGNKHVALSTGTSTTTTTIISYIGYYNTWGSMVTYYDNIIHSTSAIGTLSAKDWRSVGGVNYVSAVRNQNIGAQDFGTCLAHSVIAALESKAIINGVVTRANADFSEQIFASCCYISGDYCGGHDWGEKGKMLQYIKDTGVPVEGCVPYVGWGPYDNAAYACASYACATYLSQVYKVSSYTAVNQTVAALKTAIDTYGPIMTELTVYSDFDHFFTHHPKGVYKYNWDANPGTGSGHAVLIVGYSDSGNYFICKNSRGTVLGGDSGFFKIDYSEVGGANTNFGNSSYSLGTVSYSGIPVLQGVTGVGISVR